MQTKRGYSLLEVVIYIAILAVVSVVVIESVLSVYKAFGRLRVDRRINLNGDTAIETMVREIRSATTTDLSVSVFGFSPGILKVGGRTFSLAGADGLLQAQDSSGPAQDITSDVDVTSLFFYRETNVAPSEIIKIELTLSAGDGSFNKTKNFYGSAVLRGKY